MDASAEFFTFLLGPQLHDHNFWIFGSKFRDFPLNSSINVLGADG